MVVITMNGEMYTGTALEILRRLQARSFDERERRSLEAYCCRAAVRAAQLTGRPFALVCYLDESRLAEAFITEALRVGVLKLPAAA